MGLALKFSLIFLFAVYIPFMIMGYFSFDLVSATQEKFGLDYYNRLADLNINLIKIRSEQYINQFQSIQNSIRLNAMIDIYEKNNLSSMSEARENKRFVKWKNLYEKLIKEEMNFYEDFEGFSIISPDGELIFAIDKNQKNERLKKEFHKLNKKELKKYQMVKIKIKDSTSMYHLNGDIFLPLSGKITHMDHFLTQQIESPYNKNRKYLLSFHIRSKKTDLTDTLMRVKNKGKRDLYYFKEIFTQNGPIYKNLGFKKDPIFDINKNLPNVPKEFFNKNKGHFIDDLGNIYTIRKINTELKDADNLVLVNFNPAKIIKEPFEDIRNVTMKVLAICGLFVIPFVWLAFRGIAKKFNDINLELGRTSEKIDSSSTQILQASTELKESNQNSMDNIKGITKSMKSLNSLVEQIKSETTSAMELSNESSKAANAGEQELKELLLSMDEIVQSSKNIEKIIKIIEEISFQTNILSLNASVEAARAGEHGKGFAVVAESIRDLAEKSSDSTSEISKLIADSIERTEIGSAKALENQVKFNYILENIEKLNLIVSSISKSVDIEFTEFNTLNKALISVNRNIESLTQKSVDYNKVSTNLTDQTTSLKKLINKITAFIKGGKGQSS